MKRLFVLGDSISIHYGPALKQFVEGCFQYDRKGGLADALRNLDVPAGANGGNSELVLGYLRDLERENRLDFDILLINCGLHDIKIDPVTGEKQVDEERYAANIDSVCGLVKKTGIRMLFVTSTPVDDEIHRQRIDSFRRYDGDVVRYNEIAAETVRRYGYGIADLYSFVKKLEGDLYLDHVHFKEEVRVLQAAYLAGCLSGFVTEED